MPPDPPGLAIHVGTGDCRDALERTSRLAAAAGITRQRTLPGVHAGRAEVIEGLRRGAAGLDPRGHLLLAFTGHSDRGRAGLGRPPEVAWCLSGGPLPLTAIGTGGAPKEGALFLITGHV